MQISREFGKDRELGLIGLERTPGPMVSSIDEPGAFQHEKHSVARVQRELSFKYRTNGTCFTNKLRISGKIPWTVHTAGLWQTCHKGQSHADAFGMVSRLTGSCLKLLDLKSRVTKTTTELDLLPSQRALTARAQMSHVADEGAAGGSGKASPT
jgi:hypothetical protein